jgi:putative glutamine amidotransferase
MSKKKIIGIPGWALKADEHFGVTIPYLQWASMCGTVRIIMPGEIPEVDLLILPGGLDVSPTRYGQVPGFYTSNQNVFLESFDQSALPEYILRKTPIFGICRGLQTLVVAFGGTLHQDIAHPTSTSTADVEVHKVFHPGQDLKKTGKELFKVGSWHHQSAARVVDFMIELVAEDNIVEAVSHVELPISAVQWHPERCYDEWSYNKVIHLLGQNK